jgi:mono/diheme cytochrome c family protein
MADHLMHAPHHRFGIVLILGCVAIGCDWPWHHDMVDQPSRPAAAGPRSPAPGAVTIDGEVSIDRDTDGRSSPLVQARAAPAGRALYAIYCVPCHGTDGTGQDGPVAKYFPRVGDLMNDSVQTHTDGWLYTTITVGTQTMPAFGYELAPDERWQIVAFLRTLGH